MRRKGRVEDLGKARIRWALCYKDQQPPASEKKVAVQSSDQRGLSTFAAGLCGLSSIQWCRIRTHQFCLHPIKAPREGWHTAIPRFGGGESKVCFNQENPRHSSLNPQEIRMNKQPSQCVWKCQEQEQSGTEHSLLQVRSVWWLVAVTTFQRAYRDSPRLLSDLKITL